MIDASILSADTVVALGYMLALGVSLAVILAIANRFLFVYEDPRIDEVDSALPHANCGACGQAGCRVFAEKLIAGEAQPGQCTVNAPANNVAIAEFLGVDLGNQEKRVARLACAGGNHVAYNRAKYAGLHSCRGAAMVGGGGKTCTWGCLGMADCADVCPKKLFELHPVSHQLWVACKNLHHGEEAEAECEVACNACERCVNDSPEGLITIRDNLATIDYSKNTLASRVSIQRCPTGAIVWLNRKGETEKGSKAKPVIRKKALPVSHA